jgi:RHS repeat-associated protein
LTDAGHDGLWSYNANNQLLGYADVSHEYDDNGNMTRKLVNGVTALSYIYDVENRLVRVERGDGTTVAAYYYDPFGRRLWTEVDGVMTYFLYADEGLVGEYDANGNEIKSYGYTPNSVWSTNPLFQKTGGAYYWYQNDHLGTPQKMLDTSGRIVWSAIYDSFGNITIGTEAITNNLRLAGQYQDEETGLYYNWNRYYDPVTGRYISADPIGLNGGMNLYAYVQNDPVNVTDSHGLDPDNVAMQCHHNWVEPLASEGAYRALAIGFDYIPGLGDIKGTIETGVSLYESPGELSSWANAGITIAGWAGLDILKSTKRGPNIKTGIGCDAGDLPIRIEGEWTIDDMKQGLLGHPPKGLGRPDIHHGGQMPGAAKHEIVPGEHRNNPALHQNKYNQGITEEMRESDRQLHWWYRAREQGADQVLPGWIYD